MLRFGALKGFSENPNYIKSLKSSNRPFLISSILSLFSSSSSFFTPMLTEMFISWEIKCLFDFKFCLAITLILHYCCDKSQPGGSMRHSPLQYHSPHMLTKLNVLRFATFRDQTSRYSAEPFTHNMHTTSLIIPDLSPVVSSSITSSSTPVDKAEWAKICNLYLGKGLAIWFQISTQYIIDNRSDSMHYPPHLF